MKSRTRGMGQGVASWAAVGLALGGASALAASNGLDGPRFPERIEVEVTDVFVPEHGYDDNDHVFVVVDAVVPNTCYEATDHDTELSEWGAADEAGVRTIQVRQFARLRDEKLCAAGEAALPRPLKMKFHRPVAKEIAKQLVAGRYRMQFGVDAPRVAEFTVARAPVDTIDNLPYAPVSDVFVPAVVDRTTEGQAILTGEFQYSCQSLDPQVEVIRMGRVFVVLPKLKIDLEDPCTETHAGLQKVINLGALDPGRYMVHVRSLGGEMVYSVFTVREAPSPRGR